MYRTDTISDQADNCRLAGFPEDCVQAVDSANADASVDWQNHPALVADESLELVGLGFHKCSDEKVYWTVIATGSDDSAEESKMPDLNTGTPRYAQHCPCIVELSFGSDSLLQRPKLSNYGVYPLYPPTVASPSHLCPCQTSHHSADKREGDRPPPASKIECREGEPVNCHPATPSPRSVTHFLRWSSVFKSKACQAILWYTRSPHLCLEFAKSRNQRNTQGIEGRTAWDELCCCCGWKGAACTVII